MASDYVTLILLRPLLERLYREARDVTVDVIPVSGDTEVSLERAQVDLVIVPREIPRPPWPSSRSGPSRPTATWPRCGMSTAR